MLRIILLSLTLAIIGCGGDARVEIAASEVANDLYTEFTQVVGEYHNEVVASDYARLVAIADAYRDRVISHGDDETALDADRSAYLSALDRILADKETESVRYRTTLDNLSALSEVSAGLRKLGVDSLTLSDEYRRYIGALLDRVAPLATKPSP